MKITEALEAISNTDKKITRDNWRFKLRFEFDGNLTLYFYDDAITTYTLSMYDFNYDWEISE